MDETAGAPAKAAPVRQSLYQLVIATIRLSDDEAEELLQFIAANDLDGGDRALTGSHDPPGKLAA